MRAIPLMLAIALLPGCKTTKDGESTAPSPIASLDPTATFSLEGLSSPVWVVRTEADIPHVFGEDRADVARVHGFVVARDRFFTMDLQRRSGLGRLSELLGDQGLGQDMEVHLTGATTLAARIVAELDADPERAAVVDAFAAGVNAYIQAVADGDLPPPTEYEKAATFLGAADPVDLMQPFDRSSVAGTAAFLIYYSGYETTDIGRSSAAQSLAEKFHGVALEELRQAGLYADVWDQVEPVHYVASAPEWGGGGGGAPNAGPAPGPSVPQAVVDRLLEHAERIEARHMHDHEQGWGSNAWAVSGDRSADGRAWLAGDGHLSLTIPPLVYTTGLDTAHLGGGTLHQAGMVLPGLPFLLSGTNGRVAWDSTQLAGDITDWYAERIRLDDQGRPEASLFQGDWKPLQRYEHTIHVGGVLGSTARDIVVERWTTFDGRWITGMAGIGASENTIPGDGQYLVNMLGSWLIPIAEEDGTVAAVSFDYAGHDVQDLLRVLDDFGHAEDVGSFREATRDVVALSQNVIAADDAGSIYYSGWQATPCRHHLPRNPDGTWVAGADPNVFIEGWNYPGFTIPFADGHVDFSQSDVPERCVVPFDDYPWAVDPAQGFLLTANNDPGGLTFDGSLTNDPYYIGGPWFEGYRAGIIQSELERIVAEGSADMATMAELQANHYSGLGEQFLPVLLEAIEMARGVAVGPSDDAQERLTALYAANASRVDEAYERLSAWQDAGLAARSGVETFYDPVLPGDLEASVATTIFNAWIGRFVIGTINDEGFPDVWYPTGDTGRLRLMTHLVDGRGPGNPGGLASYNEDTEESAFFDRLGTDDVETSDEIALQALVDALDFLTGPQAEPGHGGFGTDDMSKWLWGLRHHVRFDSVLGDALDNDPLFSFLTDPLLISPERFPVADGLAPTDPRASLPGFPRHGDHLNVDAGNSGLGGTRFSYGSGPVFRLVVGLGPDGPLIQNVLPGGQSGLADSEHYDDQAKLWLGNEALALPFTPQDVAAAAIEVELYEP